MPHFPGYRYCGPGTDVEAQDRAGGPLNPTDSCCRQHDVELSAESPYNQEQADRRFITCASKEGFWGKSFAAAIRAKNIFGGIPILDQYAPGKKQPKINELFKSKKKARLGPGPDDETQPGTSGERLPDMQRMETNQEDGTGQGADGLQTSGAAATGGSGGGGQLPPMNPRPVHGGTFTIHFSRTFRHYIKTGEPAYKDVFNQQWSDVPYQHMCMSIKPRDWQMINVMAKRWRVLSCGFNMTNIIPLINQTTSVGGATKVDIAFNLMPYLETYIDKGYQLPIAKVYTNPGDLPNKGAQQNSGNQTTAALTIINLPTQDRMKPNPGAATQNLSWQHYVDSATNNMPPIDLMNSTEWGICSPSQQFNFEWTPLKADLKWRHGCMPTQYQNTPTNVASPFGRCDGGVQNQAEIELAYPNVQIHNSLLRNCIKPAPSCLIRPMTVHDADNNLLPLVFNCLVKYHSTIELDMNDFANYPLFNSEYQSIPVDGKYVFDIYENPQGGGITSDRQWCGANAMGEFYTGPDAQGYIL